MKDQRPSWWTAVLWMISPILLILMVRWLLFEPYVIPSGSMIPTLLVHDHIMVNKLRYGIRVPFSSEWVVQWSEPRRGEVVVFRYPENPDLFYVKRVLGLPGEKISVQQGVVHVNGQAVSQSPAPQPAFLKSPDSRSDGFEYYLESNDHLVRYFDRTESEYAEIQIPEGHIFVMGDNRDQSNDSRVWGTVPFEHLIGTPMVIWLSCSETFDSARFLCNPASMRWDRMLKKISDLR